VRHGLIWVQLDQDQPNIDVAGFLGEIDEDLTALDLGSHLFYRQHARVRKTNWKPSAPGEILFVHTMLIPHEPRTDKERAHWERNFAMIDEGVFGAEDLVVSEQIQKGLSSGDNETLVFGRFEQHLRRFHENVASLVTKT
jgi:Ring hydroxylating alpha subunit (catalytic domain)